MNNKISIQGLSDKDLNSLLTAKCGDISLIDIAELRFFYNSIEEELKRRALKLRKT